MVTKESGESIRTFDDDAPCRFEKEYARVKADKTDPRVAFVETFAQFHDATTALASHEHPEPFQTACRGVSDQTSNTDAFYDAAHRFFQIYVRVDTTAYTESLTYFAGTHGHEGVILDFAAEMGDLRATALAYRAGKWEDVTKDYLEPLKLSENDFLILPQYGVATRVLRYDLYTANLTHQGWLVWTGQKFEFSAAKTRVGWHCPDRERIVLADYFGGGIPKEQLPDFCRIGGNSDPEEPAPAPAQ